MTLLFLKSYAG
jgi:hypothetical protein